MFKPTAATNPLTTNLRNRLAKIRKADGGVAPNYNNPSKVRKKKTATKAASHTEEDPNRVEQIDKFMKNSPLGEKMIEDAAKDPKRFKDQFKEMRGYATKGIKINPSRRSTGKKIDRKIRQKLTKQKAAGLGALGEGKLNRKTGKPLKLKPRKKTLDDYPTEKAKLAAGMANIGKKPWMQKDYLKKKGKHLEKTALRSAVNKVNPIKPTKTYKDTINPQEEDPDRIKQNATTIGRKPTYFGKTKKRIARIRKAGEQIDPRVKKRKTVRPDSPVQKVSQMKDRIAELKTAKEHSHSIAFRKHEGQYYRRASLTKQEGKYAKYWLLNANKLTVTDGVYHQHQ